LRFDRKIAMSMVHYGFGASMLSILWQLWSLVDPAVVGRVLGQQALGLYTVAFRLPTLLLENIAYQVSLVAFPALAKKRVTDSAGVGASTLRLIRYQSLYSLPLAAGIAVLARPIVETVFSAKWRDASGVVAAVSILSGISASTFALGDGFKALGRQRVMVVMGFLEFPLVVGTVVAAAPYGIAAVAWARTGSEVLWSTLMVIAAARVLGVAVKGTIAALWPGTVAAAGVVVGAGAVRLLSGLPAVPELIAGTVVGTTGALIALALLSPSMFRELRGAATGVRGRFRRTASPPVPRPGALVDPRQDREVERAPPV
jgi:lipopolysaccharide exporter